MKKKVALITGITGQDGAYLSKYLLKLGYIVHGIKRRSSLFNTSRIDNIYQDPHVENRNFILHYGDMTDSMNITRIIQEIKPDEIYNLAAMSHVKVSFDTPEYTANTDGIGTLRLLEAVRLLKMEKKCKIYQASTSELYGKVQEIPQSETTPFYPRSPYGVAKLYSYWIIVNYREAYDIFASNGILFNHESPLRGETFVTRKITRAAAQIAFNMKKKFYLGNLDSKRDWGHAKDYVRAMHLILQYEKGDDFVIATGETTSVREFVIKVFSEFGIELDFKGKGVNEKGIISFIDSEKFEKLTLTKPSHLKKGDIILEVDPGYFRPTEVEILIGNPAKAKKLLGWEAEYTIDELINEMVIEDVEYFKRSKLLINNGHLVIKSCEEEG